MESRLSLFELNRLIRNTLDANLRPGYWVVAEIGEMRQNQRGHCYMELVEKENTEIKAKIRANIWAYTYRNISGWFESMTGESLAPGMKILAFVKVQFHELYGISLNVQDIDPQYTLGERARKRQEVIKQLKEEGVFDMNKQLTLPLVPQRLAIISSSTAAGFGDFVHQLENNRQGYYFEMVLFQALMQGEKAPASIMEAMYQVHDQMDCFDALVIIRGGGSQVDLDCFDSYEVASHIAQFPMPVFTGIGHERDETVADLVAHTHLKTPTAVAEFLLSGAARFEERLDDAMKNLLAYSSKTLNEASRKMERLSAALHIAGRQKMSKEHNRLEILGHRIAGRVRQKLETSHERLAVAEKNLLRLPANRLKDERKKLEFYEKALHLQHPDRLLEKGYTLSLVNGKPLKEATGVTPGQQLETKGKNFSLLSTITEVKDGKR